ncbi:hypothetical protein tinsulaeT_15290 [Thalassotalea insulae]|uniref:Glycosyltransferase 2-like domain-containing protein n=1 Tax=Thalassotalea insulae TaxID=2056778 RepID=A0ABQ6GSP2_9GAMM|nr:glycosyltransferase [Thalassotalea insulae]GLX78189.1 hypothetical protein tinsulaeT_15290 [Thalassotalea insulae]
MSIVFFSSLLTLIYTFIGYPLFLKFVKKDTLPSILTDEQLPPITVVLCVYNSASLLKNRIENILSCDYPKDKLNILIISDGSTDEPDKIIAQIDNPAVKLLHYPENQGKSYALSYAFNNISTPYSAFTDIRQSFNRDALKQLASTVTMKNIGAASGNLKIITHDETDEQGLYWKYEKAIRIKESDLNSLLGVSGAIYMARTELLPNIPSDSLLDDMYIPLSMVKKGYKVKFCEQAIAYDRASTTIGEEFTRKVRTLAGNYQLVKQMPWLLSIKDNPLFFQFLSHKIARLVMPFALILLFISSCFITTPLQPAIIISQGLFYSYSLFGYLVRNRNLKLPLMSTCISFCSLNLAALIACWKYFTTDDMTTLWKKH